MLTALRSDGHTTVFAGMLALLQYGVLSAVIFATVTSLEQLISSDYGAVTASTRIQRMLLLATVTLLTATVVYQTQRLVELSGTDGLARLPSPGRPTPESGQARRPRPGDRPRRLSRPAERQTCPRETPVLHDYIVSL